MFNRNYLAWNMLREAELADERYQQRIHGAQMRAKMDPLRYKSDKKFIKLYRLTKESFVHLCALLRQHTDLKSTQRVSLEEKVLCALLFYAKGGYQCAIGEANHFSQEAISMYIKEVTNALMHPNMLRRFIKFPETQQERDNIKQRFYALYGIPGVLGCIDGSHFKIFKPERNVEHLYYCRKHYHSINVQMICDADSKILAINPKFGGATHDAFIWENSIINDYLQRLYRENEPAWLLGDSGYPQRPWIMTPYTNVPLNADQEIYNTKHSKARVIIENTFGRLKNRWRCCIKYRALHYEPTKCAEIIIACCVLHNFAIEHNVPDPDYDNDYDEEAFERHDAVEERNGSDLVLGRALRDQLARRLALQLPT